MPITKTNNKFKVILKSSFNKIFISFCVLGVLISAITLPALASSRPVDPCSITGFCLGGVQNNARYSQGSVGENARNIILDAASVLTFVAASVAILFIVYQAFQMLNSQGDSKKYGDAVKGIVYAFAGLVLSVVAYGLVAGIINVILNFRV
jgi:hypothetical protein